MGFKNWFKKTVISDKEEPKISEEEQEKREIKKLTKYANELMKEPLKLEISKEGFPLCPICGEEFKDKETIISHLKRNKKEFGRLSGCGYPIKIEKEYDKDSMCNELYVGGHSFLLEDGEGEEKNVKFNEWKGTIEWVVRIAKLFKEINQRTYKEWRGENEKRKIREHSISPRFRFEILKRDNFTCQYCGKKAPDVELEVDHIEPYSKTKNNNPENLITACKECNRGKKEKDVV